MWEFNTVFVNALIYSLAAKLFRESLTLALRVVKSYQFMVCPRLPSYKCICSAHMITSYSFIFMAWNWWTRRLERLLDTGIGIADTAIWALILTITSVSVSNLTIIRMYGVGELTLVTLYSQARILTSLGHLGFSRWKRPWVEFLKDEINSKGKAIGLFCCWLHAIFPLPLCDGHFVICFKISWASGQLRGCGSALIHHWIPTLDVNSTAFIKKTGELPEASSTNKEFLLIMMDTVL